MSHDTLMYFVTFWCGKCQTGSVVTVQSQFERGTIKIKFLIFCLKGVIPLKNSPTPSMLNKRNLSCHNGFIISLI